MKGLRYTGGGGRTHTPLRETDFESVWTVETESESRIVSSGEWLLLGYYLA
jgi:hypothetical protein